MFVYYNYVHCRIPEGVSPKLADLLLKLLKKNVQERLSHST